MSVYAVVVLLLLVAYLLGSIPSAVWLGKWFHGIDLRDHGSGNAGATNAFRILGKPTALAVLILDMGKGMAAVALAGLISTQIANKEVLMLYQLLLGFVALTGHVFPVFASFRGGKGIATLTGIVAVLFPLTMVVCLAVFLLVFSITRYVSLGSMLAAISFPIAMWLLPGELLISQLLFSLMVAVFVPLTHRKNIIRLMQGTENKISFRKP